MLVGDTSVGKTCLIERYLDNDFKFSENSESKVLEVQHLTKPVGSTYENQVKVEIYDTSSCEKTAATAAAAYSERQEKYLEADIFLLCVDTSRHVEHLKSIEKWKKEIKEVVD